MPLREFTERGKKPATGAQLHVLKNGKVSINAAALKILGNPTHVVLLFDDETSEFGVRAAQPEEPHSYKLTADARGRTGASIAGTSLWRFYNIEIEQYVGNYDARLEKNILVITLTRHAE